MPRVVPSQIRLVIDKLFPWAATQIHSRPIPRQWAPSIPGLLHLLKQLPDDLITLEGTEYAEFFRSVGDLEMTVSYWLSSGGMHELAVRGELDPVSSIRRLLEKCPDQVPARPIAEIAFVEDVKHRETIRQDIDEAEGALQSGRWKAATISAGAAVEALLLWALLRIPPDDVKQAAGSLKDVGEFTRRPGTPLNEMSLTEYIALAESMALIKPDTAIQARLAKNFRNLIHPGKAHRAGQVCDRATARSAVAALDHVIRDLDG